MLTLSYAVEVQPVNAGLYRVTWPAFPKAVAEIPAPSDEEALLRAIPHTVSLMIGELQRIG